ncbi:MAG: 1-(5-phosphoribosyl)-5-[(5-phosphoribosylamino)methylideneamino] imidazole-4-carboxamide isomerase [Puniceicoccales bacterium]|nr:1-(5-phosphoribosyl)-5-[(5-phosphoribosylamino)methylideneamino] imidazole-4-carboxamide isomerase [Puniceicoccales bacterium]
MFIYPAIDIKDGRCVRLRQGLAGETTAYHDDPAVPAAAYQASGVGWIHVVDLDGAFDGTPRNLAALRRIASAAPGAKIQFGGGLRDAGSIAAAFEAGATRVVIGTRAAADEVFAAEMLSKHGTALAIGIDAKDGFVAVKGWVEVTPLRATEFAARMAALGARTFIYTDIATDGMLSGPNFPALREMLGASPANVIASGGFSCREDLLRLREMRAANANLDGVIVGKALYEKRVELGDLLALARAPLA